MVSTLRFSTADATSLSLRNAGVAALLADVALHAWCGGGGGSGVALAARAAARAGIGEGAGGGAPPAVLLAELLLTPLSLLSQSPIGQIDAGRWQAAGVGAASAGVAALRHGGAALRHGGAAATAVVGAVAAHGRGIKPLRALWELIETDAWLYDVIVEAARRLRAACWPW